MELVQDGCEPKPKNDNNNNSNSNSNNNNNNNNNNPQTRAHTARKFTQTYILMQA